MILSVSSWFFSHTSSLRAGSAWQRCALRFSTKYVLKRNYRVVRKKMGIFLLNSINMVKFQARSIVFLFIWAVFWPGGLNNLLIWNKNDQVGSYGIYPASIFTQSFEAYYSGSELVHTLNSNLESESCTHQLGAESQYKFHACIAEIWLTIVLTRKNNNDESVMHDAQDQLMYV